MHPCFIRGNKVLCSYMSRHCSVPKPNVPLHWMCPSKLIPGSEKIDSNRISNMINRGMRDFATEAFHLEDIIFPQAPKDIFSDQIISKIPTDGICKNGICKNQSVWSSSKEIVRGYDQELFGDNYKNLNYHVGYYVPDSVLEPTPLREDFQANSNIGLMPDQLSTEEIDVLRNNDSRSCHTISLLLEPLSDETIEDFF